LSSKNRKKISEEEKYQTNDEVLVFVKPTPSADGVDFQGIYRGIIADYFIQDGHRTLEVYLAEDIVREKQTNIRITATDWRRTQGRWDDCPNIWVNEYLEGWMR